MRQHPTYFDALPNLEWRIDRRLYSFSLEQKQQGFEGWVRKLIYIFFERQLQIHFE